MVLNELQEILLETYKDPELKLNKGDKVKIKQHTFLGFSIGSSIEIEKKLK